MIESPVTPITFKAELLKIKNWTIVRLPDAVSTRMPSRGLVMADISIGDIQFQAPLEPDGNRGHWFRLMDTTMQSCDISAGDTVAIRLTPATVWHRPTPSPEFTQALRDDPEAADTWQSVTPKAQWEWIRWIRATNNPATLRKHIDVACSKLRSGMRRPCCFNSGMCTEPYVSHKGVLLTATAVR